MRKHWSNIYDADTAIVCNMAHMGLIEWHGERKQQQKRRPRMSRVQRKRRSIPVPLTSHLATSQVLHLLKGLPGDSAKQWGRKSNWEDFYNITHRKAAHNITEGSNIIYSFPTVNSSGVQNFARPLTTCLHFASPTSISSTNKLHYTEKLQRTVQPCSKYLSQFFGHNITPYSAYL